MMSQVQDESLNSVESEDNNDDEHVINNNATDSASGNDTDSDSDDDSGSSTESSDGHNSPEPQPDDENACDAQQHFQQRKDHNIGISSVTTSVPKTATVAGLPSTAAVAANQQGNSKTNGFTDDDENNSSDSDSNSDTNSDSNTEEDDENGFLNESANRADKEATKAKSENSILETHNKTNESGITNTTNNTTTTTDHNTSHTSVDDDDDDKESNNDDDEEEGDKGSTNSSSNSSNDDSNAEDEPKAKAVDGKLHGTAKHTSKTSGVAVKSTLSAKGFREIDSNDDNGDVDEHNQDNGSESAETTKSDESFANSEPTESSSSSSSEDEDDYQPKRSTRPARKPTRAATEKYKPAPPQKKRKKNSWVSDDSDESDENSDGSATAAPPKRKPPKSKIQSRRSKKAYSSDDSEDDSKRFGTRRKAAAVSYKEASENEQTDSEDLLEVEYDESQQAAAAAAAEEEEKSETIERVLAKRQGKKGCTGNQTTIYAIEESGCDPNEGAENLPPEESELQYHIKWKGWSYIHNTWESENTLREQKVKGMKKLENFIKKEQEVEYWRRYAGPEDIDYFECQLELQNDLLKSYNNVDRIIARNVKPEGANEYLCKWQSLPYAEATWEDASLVTRKWQRCVEQFEDREMSKCTPSRHCKVLKYRPKFYKIKEQPEFLAEGLLLRDYQMDGLNWLLHAWCKENSVILADEMGLGKTIQTICFLYSLFKTHHLYGPFLCVVPLSTMTAWQREFELWAPGMNVVTYLGDVKSREMIRQYEWQFDGSKRLKFNCILTTYEIVLKDKIFLGTLQWAALLVDEAHRLKNDDSLLYKSLKEFATNHRLLITGTPLQNSLKELWALLHFIMPEKFDTWENFESEHGDAADKGYHKLHQQLEPYILRRVKKDVEKSLPAKVEQILRVEMTSMQKQYYKWILTKNFEALRKGKKGSTSTFLNIVIELKKCCNHAALIRPSEFDLHGMQQDEALQTLLKGSGKLVLLDKLLCRLKETGHRVLIFSQMVRMLDVLADYLQKRHFSFQRLDGSIKGEMRKQALDHFNADGSQDFCFLLSTRAGGLGINLATADTVIIFDSDWNPQNDLQAQARAHRIGQKNQVNIYRLVTARSVEENIVERAKQKMVLDHLVIQRMDTTGRTVLDKGSGGASSNTNPFNKDDLSAILKFGAEELFKDEQENDDELVCDIDEILRRAETRNDDPEMPGDDLLSAFKVASIVAFEEEPSETAKDNSTAGGGEEDDTKDWDDIIPENFRQVVENEERVKEMEDLYLPPRRKTAANNDTPTKRGRRTQQDGSDTDDDMGSDVSGDDGRPKRRGRPTMKEKINGFTDAEIRRFIRSYKKFPAPLLRLEAIACDAELQEKPLAELKRIGEMLHDRCVHLLEEHKDELTGQGKLDETPAAKQKRTRSTFSLKLGGVSFNAKTLLTCEEELKPLNEIIPSAANERSTWALTIKTRPANFDVDWGVDEDSKLLCGIYQYGIGSWEQMKMDPDLKLTEKILFNDARKPQTKHLQSRAEYLLKIIKKNLELKKGVERKQRKPRKPREAKTGAASSTGVGSATASSATSVAAVLTTAGNESSKSRKISETHGDDISMSGNDATQDRKLRQTADNGSNADGTANDTDTTATTVTTKKKSKRNAASSFKEGKSGSVSATASGTNDSKVANSGRTKKASISDKTNKPMHFTANNEPRALEVLGDLDPTVFNECKEKMRPVKKSLKALDRPDSSLSTEQQDENTRQCLLAIGKQIDICLEAYSEPDKREWRSNLWYFVSKFTEFDARKLFKLYKNTLKSTEEGENSEKLNKAASKSPVKIATKEENGNVKDKTAKKKKKDKDKNNDKGKVREKDNSSNHDFKPFDKAKRNSIMDTPIKRKRDDMSASMLGSGGAMHDGKNSYKRMAMDRNRDDRKKHYRDDYYGGGNSHDDYDRRNQLNSPSNSRLSNASRIQPSTPSGYNPTGSGMCGEGKDRWGGHNRDRYGNSSEFKRDRYDGYNNRSSGGGGGYHRADHRDRRSDKRRYPPSHLPPHPTHNYPPHYMPPNFYLGNGIMPPGGGISHVGYRGDPRYTAAGDWPRDYPPDYRRSTGGGSGIASGGGGSTGDRRTQT